MSNRFRVAPGHEFHYPADPTSLKIVQDAGGVSKLSPEQRLQVTYKKVAAGEDCSDMPPSALAFHLSVGEVIEDGGVAFIPAPVVLEAPPIPVVVVEEEHNG